MVVFGGMKMDRVLDMHARLIWVWLTNRWEADQEAQQSQARTLSANLQGVCVTQVSCFFLPTKNHWRSLCDLEQQRNASTMMVASQEGMKYLSKS